jgi:RNA polymerase subunit RPABC4/transcription elongation factor Spt4
MGWIIFFVALAWLIFRTNVSPYLVVPLAVVIACVGEHLLEIFLRGLMSYRHEPYSAGRGYGEEEEAESRRYALLRAAMHGLSSKPERPETGRGIPEEVEEQAYKQAMERVETRSPAPPPDPPSALGQRQGRSIGLAAAATEERLVPGKARDTHSAGLGQVIQQGWSCPTCGSPSKTTRWEGDEVIRVCGNGHRSVVWRRSGEQSKESTLPPTQHQPPEEAPWLATREAFQRGWSAKWLRTQEGQAWLKSPEGQDYIRRLGRVHDSPRAAGIEGRVVPSKTQEPPVDLGGQALQRGWSCPTCGSPGKAAHWEGDEVIRECVNGHRSVLATAAERAWSQEASGTLPPWERFVWGPFEPYSGLSREELLTILESQLKSLRPRRRQKWLYVLDVLRCADDTPAWQGLIDSLEKKRPHLIRGKPNEVIDKLMKELRKEWLH